MTTYQKHIGNKGEALAAAFLEDMGYQLLDQNYSTRYGELDLVMQDKSSIVFIEVKTRTSSTFGMPEASVTPSKIAHLQDAGLLWLQSHPDAPDDWRIDVVAIQLDQRENILDIQHFVNISS